MIKSLVAHTSEVDSKEDAISEILEQLDIENKLLKNSVGILSCYAEFIDSDIVKELSNKLPFDIVGTTTIGNSTNGDMSHTMLSLLVLTSDDVQFATGVSEPINDDPARFLSELYDKTKSELAGDPKLMITFAPLIFNIGGDVITDILNDASGGVPIFGTVCIDHHSDYRDAQVFRNGEGYKNSTVILLLSGDVDPEFKLVSISDKKILKQKAVITESEGNILKKVNDIPALQYLEKLGLAKEGNIEGINSVPYIIDLNDGSKPIARAIYGATPEGYTICGGAMPVGATLSVGSIDYDDVVETSAKTLNDILKLSQNDFALMFSCLSRIMALGLREFDEMKIVEDTIGDKIPFQFVYSGGEICPVFDKNGKIKNSFHNDTLVVCLL
jgi:hypothetical protein